MFSTCSSHSFLVKPEADWRSKHRAQCRRGGPEADATKQDNCHGPCISKKSWFYRNDSAHTVWKRGSKQIVEWTRNGHRTGFVRLTLVPVKKRESRKAHTKHTFHFACFEVNKKPCIAGANGMFCGTDRWLYATEVTVPDYVEDGEYVLGWSWYGAYASPPKGSTQKFHFGDYWSCAYITIQGGTEVVKRKMIPSFDHGGKGRCSAMTNKLGVCQVEPCLNKFRETTPKLWCPRGAKWKDGRCQFKGKANKKRRPRKFSKKELKRRYKIWLKKRAKRSLKRMKSKSKKWLKARMKMKREKRSKCWCAVREKSTTESPIVSALVVVGLKKNGGPSWKNTDCVCSGDRINVNKYKHGFTLMAFVYGYHPNKLNFYVDGKNVQTEKKHPYTIAGNGGWKFNKYHPPLSKSIDYETIIEEGGQKYSVDNVRFVDEETN